MSGVVQSESGSVTSLSLPAALSTFATVLAGDRVLRGEGMTVDASPIACAVRNASIPLSAMGAADRNRSISVLCSRRQSTNARSDTEALDERGAGALGGAGERRHDPRH
jgi:hypothetical protein